MVDPVLPLALFGVAGLTPSVAIASLRFRDAERWSASLVPYRVEMPSGCDPASLQNFLGTLTGLLPARWERPLSVRGIGVEIVSNGDEGISQILLVPSYQSEIVIGQLRANVPGVRLTAEPDFRLREPTLAGELETPRPDYPLNTDRPATVTTNILTALTPLDAGEQLSIHWTLHPLPPRTAPPGSSAATGILARLVGPSNRPEAPPIPKAVLAKYLEPLFAVSARVAIRSGSAARDRQLLSRVVAAFHAANSPDATLRRRKVSSRQAIQRIKKRYPVVFARTCLLNSAELSGLLALATPESVVAGLRLGSSPSLPASTDIPTAGIVVGASNFTGSERPLALTIRALQQHLHVCGPSGVGKTALLNNIARQVIAAGWGLISLDPKRDGAHSLLGQIPIGRQGDVVWWDPLDDRPIGLNILNNRDGDPDLAAEQVFAILHKLNREWWGPRLADLLMAALHTLARTPGATLCELPLLLSNTAYRARVVGAIDDPIGLNAVWAWFDSLTPGEQSQAISPILNKTRPWLVRSRLRHVLGQADPLLDIDEVMAEQRILLAPLSAGELGDEASALLGVILLTKVFQATMRRLRLPAAERRPLVVIVDEAQVLANLPTPMTEMLALARGAAVAVVGAHQTLSQLDAPLREALLGTARSHVVFQCGSADAARFAREFSPYVTAEQIQHLGAYEVVASLSTGDRVAPPATAITHPLPPDNGQSDLVRELSRQRWGRDRAEVEAELRRRHEGPRGTGPVGRRRRSS